MSFYQSLLEHGGAHRRLEDKYKQYTDRLDQIDKMPITDKNKKLLRLKNSSKHDSFFDSMQRIKNGDWEHKWRPTEEYLMGTKDSRRRLKRALRSSSEIPDEERKELHDSINQKSGIKIRH